MYVWKLDTNEEFNECSQWNEKNEAEGIGINLINNQVMMIFYSLISIILLLKKLLRFWEIPRWHFYRVGDATF